MSSKNEFIQDLQQLEDDIVLHLNDGTENLFQDESIELLQHVQHLKLLAQMCAPDCVLLMYAQQYASKAKQRVSDHEELMQVFNQLTY